VTPAAGSGGPATPEELAWVDRMVEPLLATEFLAGLEDLPLDRIRAMRRSCVEAEVVVSFLRRILHGRLDVVETMLDARRKGTPTTLADLVGRLPAILAQPPPATEHRLVGPFAPDTDAPELVEALTAALGPERLGELLEAGEDELAAMAEETRSLERRISSQRRALHETIERLGAELVERYRSNRASIDDSLA
jgi:hypothetical protein